MNSLDITYHSQKLVFVSQQDTVSSQHANTSSSSLLTVQSWMGPMSRIRDCTCKSFGSLIMIDNPWSKKTTTDWSLMGTHGRKQIGPWIQHFSVSNQKKKKRMCLMNTYETMWKDWKCTLTNQTLSHMSLTFRGSPGEFYPLLHEAQPSNSCWQSCLSANHQLTWWTNTRVWNIWEAAEFNAF